MNQYRYTSVPAPEVPPDVLRELQALGGSFRYAEATSAEGWFRLDRATGELFRVEKEPQ